MLPFIARRLLQALPILLVASFLSFVLVALSGDPLQDLRANPRISEAQIQAKAEELNLDKPLVQRYLIWLGDIIHGDFGKDTKGNDVWPQLHRALGVTLRLVLVA